MCKYKKLNRVLSQFCDGEAVLYDTERELYFSLDEVGTAIWSVLEAPVDITSIVESVVSEFEVEPDEAKRDIEALLLDLEDSQLVERLTE